MKHIFTIIALTLCVVLNTACTKEDDADAYVGKYSVSATSTSTWGGMSHTSAYSGTMYITKVSANRVQTSGWFNTYGEVIGNAIYLESCSTNDSEMSVTNVFGVGVLNGNVLTFSCTTSGRMDINGTWYSYYSSSQHTCIKQQ